MNKIIKVTNSKAKQQVCNEILRSLPNWFGIEAAIIDYVNNIGELPVLVYQIDNNNVGFIALKQHNQFTMEIMVMGVLPSYHRQGIGKQLVDSASKYCLDNNIDFLTVKTLAETSTDPYYAQTREFYLNIGFRPLEIFPTLWDENNPCLLMIKCLKSYK
jgi:ribosomal protein S18 acetylase RimI-like enzyme